MPALRALIVDDEPLARERLRTLLIRDPEVELVGECADGRSAVDAVRDLAPDLVFLDVQMPVLDGFEVVEQVGTERMPPVVFVTAYDEYALQAFDVCALDYLLKPFDEARFERTLSRAKQQARKDTSGEIERRLRALLSEIRTEGDASDGANRLVIKSRGRIKFVHAEEVEWIEASGNYVRLHVAGGSHLLRGTMTGILERLPAADFIRVGRSAIVRIDAIRELKPRTHSEYTIVLRSGARVKSSRGYRDQIGRLLEE